MKAPGASTYTSEFEHIQRVLDEHSAAIGSAKIEHDRAVGGLRTDLHQLASDALDSSARIEATLGERKDEIAELAVQFEALRAVVAGLSTRGPRPRMIVGPIANRPSADRCKHGDVYDAGPDGVFMVTIGTGPTGTNEWNRLPDTFRTGRDEVQATQRAPQKGEDRPMSETKEPGLAETLKDDGAAAAWRAAGSQFVKLTRDPLVALLARHLAPGDDAVRGRIAAFLQTPIGTAMLASLLSVALSAMPRGVGGVAPAMLARELRVRVMADAGDLAAELLMGPLREIMGTFLRDMPGVVVAPAALPEPPRVAATDITTRVAAVPVERKAGGT